MHIQIQLSKIFELLFIIDLMFCLQEVMQDIENIKDDVARVKERGRQIVEASDPEGYKAMQSTLSMLNDRVDNLQVLADNKGKQLQV